MDSESYVQSFPPLQALAGGAFYCSGEELLKLTILNAAAGVTVTLSGRTLAFGETRPSPFKQTLVPATDRSASTVFVGLPAGWLLNAQAIVTAGAPLIGQCFARLSLVRGGASVNDEFATLAAGYVTAKQSLAFPGSEVLGSTDGAAALRSVAGATPAAGAEISETVPTGARWELLSFNAHFLTSAAVANRVVALTLDDGTNVLSRAPNSFAQTATVNDDYEWFQGAAIFPATGTPILTSPVPVGNRLAAGARIKTVTLNIQAADQWSAVQYLVREWIEGA